MIEKYPFVKAAERLLPLVPPYGQYQFVATYQLRRTGA
jgi:hypothetical protein